MVKQIILLIAALVLITYGKGVTHLPQDQHLYWSFPDEMSVKFELYVPLSFTEEYEWTGFGLKEVSKISSMKDADITMIYLNDDRIEDCWSSMNARPDPDIEVEGFDSLTEKSVNVVDDYKVYTWIKMMNTGDEKDMVLSQGAQAGIIWAYGAVNSEGKPKKHKGTDRGYHEITLSEDFNDGEIVSLI
ncbi:unnamed protein product [Blepharisma stoltei]|uniref:DOMON domain-containing protein n=1 Tax=Blepharisma stoltei TaxID=1481888 RepID=A0AAU9JCJ9_9CILI|nr:unnamed protein product [Blepharisma stoltei]